MSDSHHTVNKIAPLHTNTPFSKLWNRSITFQYEMLANTKRTLLLTATILLAFQQIPRTISNETTQSLSLRQDEMSVTGWALRMNCYISHAHHFPSGFPDNPDTQTSKYRSFQYRGAHRQFSTFLMVNSCGEENLRPRTHIIWNLIDARTGTQAEVCQTCSQKASYDLHTYLLKPPRWTPPPPAWTPQWWTPPTSAWTVPPTKRILLSSRPLHSSLERPTPPVR